MTSLVLSIKRDVAIVLLRNPKAQEVPKTKSTIKLHINMQHIKAYPPPYSKATPYQNIKQI